VAHGKVTSIQGRRQRAEGRRQKAESRSGSSWLFRFCRFVRVHLPWSLAIQGREQKAEGRKQKWIIVTPSFLPFRPRAFAVKAMAPLPSLLSAFCFLPSAFCLLLSAFGFAA
jgi:hypothetical protein